MARPTCGNGNPQRGCGAIIRWIKTTEGKNMPVNPSWLSEWVTEQPTSSGSRKIVLVSADDGKTNTGYQASVITPGARQIEGYEPHWGTCPKAYLFRGGGNR